jgi:peroxiredoxin
MLVAASVVSCAALAAPAAAPVSGSRAPAISLTDTSGTPRTLAGYAGHPVSLFFFCGCPWCHRCARLWGQLQHGGALDKTQAPTLVVFQGDAGMAKEFVAETGLDPTRTVVLPDPNLSVTLAYGSDVCPRVFVIDASGKIAYTNNHPGDAPRKAPESAIVGGAVGALQKLTAH